MSDAGTAPLLAVDGLQAWYGESHVLHGATFDVHAGEVVTLLGRAAVFDWTVIGVSSIALAGCSGEERALRSRRHPSLRRHDPVQVQGSPRRCCKQPLRYLSPLGGAPLGSRLTCGAVETLSNGRP